MGEEQIQELVAKVVRRLAERLGATGDKGPLVVIFTAATVEFPQAVQQVRNLVLRGFQVRLAFSPAAEHLVSKAVQEQLDGFPHVSLVEPTNWLGTLMEARAVVVPLLSLNTLSKLSLLIADNLAANFILHALLMGKPVIMARNGADPSDAGRQELGFHRGRPGLAQAMKERLRTVEEYGCTLTDVRSLSETVSSLLLSERMREVQSVEPSQVHRSPAVDISNRFITAVDVLHAWRTGTELNAGHPVRMTPLARELARRYGVVMKIVD